jgi:hypothetical protein
MKARKILFDVNPSWLHDNKRICLIGIPAFYFLETIQIVYLFAVQESKPGRGRENIFCQKSNSNEIILAFRLSVNIFHLTRLGELTRNRTNNFNWIWNF